MYNVKITRAENKYSKYMKWRTEIEADERMKKITQKYQDKGYTDFLKNMTVKDFKRITKGL